jgi:hypothetical protein
VRRPGRARSRDAHRARASVDASARRSADSSRHLISTTNLDPRATGTRHGSATPDRVAVPVGARQSCMRKRHAASDREVQELGCSPRQTHRLRSTDHMATALVVSRNSGTPTGACTSARHCCFRTKGATRPTSATCTGAEDERTPAGRFGFDLQSDRTTAVPPNRSCATRGRQRQSGRGTRRRAISAGGEGLTSRPQPPQEQAVRGGRPSPTRASL